MKDTKIKVTNNVGRVVKNPYEFYDNEDTTTRSCENAEYRKFEQTAIAHYFSTNAPDGEYLFSDFGEEVWQYKENEVWHFEEYGVSKQYESFKEYEERHQPMWETRRFRYINQPKAEEQPETVEQAAKRICLEVNKNGERYKFWADNGMSSRKNGDTFVSFEHGFQKGSNWKEQQLTATIQQKEIEIASLKWETQKLSEALISLQKSLPLINSDIKVTDDIDKSDIIKKAIEGAALLLKTTFDMCKLSTHINGKVAFDEINETYELSFKPVNPNR